MDLKTFEKLGLRPGTPVTLQKSSYPACFLNFRHPLGCVETHHKPNCTLIVDTWRTPEHGDHVILDEDDGYWIRLYDAAAPDDNVVGVVAFSGIKR